MSTPPLLAARPQNFDFTNLDASRHAAHTVQATPANVRATNHTFRAKLREERLPVRESHRGPHTRLRETATTPTGSTAHGSAAHGSTTLGATASGPAQRHRGHAARHEI
ncbi:hypothetical protein [Streptomyces spectabilis]|uniref:Uncharacterized protein n=1 Tax=Streptomyces spectabilis TaxID=68270 RepID=A0A7W8EUA7_STRST|nr:hypothetical protein [Streptomyces spectabilis]MBB5105657.1 hypothetical protein [Streptomyces spectabilis]GGV23025.1 hypothetical protein GCM10010245_38620 [Streptomyces spectabilis]